MEVSHQCQLTVGLIWFECQQQKIGPWVFGTLADQWSMQCVKKCGDGDRSRRIMVQGGYEVGGGGRRYGYQEWGRCYLHVLHLKHVYRQTGQTASITFHLWLNMLIGFAGQEPKAQFDVDIVFQIENVINKDQIVERFSEMAAFLRTHYLLNGTLRKRGWVGSAKTVLHFSKWQECLQIDRMATYLSYYRTPIFEILW